MFMGEELGLENEPPHTHPATGVRADWRPCNKNLTACFELLSENTRRELKPAEKSALLRTWNSEGVPAPAASQRAVTGMCRGEGARVPKGPVVWCPETSPKHPNLWFPKLRACLPSAGPGGADRRGRSRGREISQRHPRGPNLSFNVRTASGPKSVSV